jgi:hypothetical protein
MAGEARDTILTASILAKTVRRIISDGLLPGSK